VHTCFNTVTPNTFAVAEDGGDVNAADPFCAGTVAVTVFVRSAVSPVDAQKNSREAPATTVNEPATVTHDGSLASFNVIPVNAVSPGLVTVIRQNPVDPDGTVVAAAHGPVSDVQLAATLDVQTCLSTDTPNTLAVADEFGEVNDGVPGGEPAGGGATAAAVFVVFVVIEPVEQRNAVELPAATLNVPAAVTQDGSTASVRVTPVRFILDGLVTVIRQKAADPDGTVAAAAHGPAPDWHCAATDDVHTSLSTLTENTRAVADAAAVVNAGGPGTVAVTVFVRSAVKPADEQNTS
jgi:hypothetical protein